MDLLVTLLAVAATVLGSAMGLPQARRIVPTQRVDGVSPAWIGVSVALNGWWIAYAVATGLWLVLPVSAVSMAFYVTMAIVFVRTVGARSLVGLGVGAGVLGMAPLPFLLGGGWTPAGVAIGLSYGLQLLPAVVGVYRTRRLGGVSSGTWTICLLEAVLWLGVGVGVADLPVIVSGITGAAMAAMILVRLAITGHLGRPQVPGRLRRFEPSGALGAVRRAEVAEPIT